MTIFSPRTFAAVDLSLPDVHGHVHRLSDYRGQWVILNFWATWCPPCLEEIPDLLLFHEAYKSKGAVVIGVNFEELAKSELISFIDEQFIDYPILLMEPNANTPLGKVFGLPTTFIVSPNGEVAKVHMGAVTFTDLEDYIQLPYTKTRESHR
jgi:thiol-disulfide isomerase/thioredoxin